MGPLKTIIFMFFVWLSSHFGKNTALCGPEWDAIYYFGKLFPEEAEYLALTFYPPYDGYGDDLTD